MASRSFSPNYGSLDKGMVELDGYVDIAADASVSASSFSGGTITKTNTGEYTLTLTDTYTSLKSAQLTVQAATAVDLVPQMVSQTVSTTKLVVFKLLAAAVATNPAAVCRVYINLRLKNTSA
jgi:hypothetical protein